MIKRLVSLALVAMSWAGLAQAQDQALFEAGLGECARYIAAQPTTVWTSQVAPLDVDEDEGGIKMTVVYPQGSGGGFDFAVSFDHARGNSTTPGTWTCSGSGPKSPQWPQFNTTGWIGADARLRSNGLVELKFPPPQRAYANCTADAPDIYLLFNAGDGDRVVFAATTGPAAAAFCSSMGWKG
ncbi:hypothetical protein KUV51_09080 [Tateyamaria omphalii]|uniref:hypothetical protein n=1 Tax=Tateyamaria omphalii TaxID=299262 RepID=UPI001C99E2B3|nr:hypothetical protein [Tateyamaria omphalii]MBY5933146.1 hypothetical protein [Tateyamaria omphalii]